MSNNALLSIKDLRVDYETPGGWRPKRTSVVKGISLDIEPGQTYGLVGESGSGKSTTGKAVLRLAPISGGSITFDGRDVASLGRGTPLSYRRDVQAVFQDPTASANPRHRVGRAVTDLLQRHGVRGEQERRNRALEAFEQVGLSPAHLDRHPAQLSGGQLQRVAIARALSLRPKLVVCDEAVSALDLSTQGQIINLLADLQRSSGVSYLFIAHDLGVVRHISHQVGVLRKGELVEQGSCEQIFSSPQHPYTKALLAASPASHPKGREARHKARVSARRRLDATLKAVA